ncbi:hypothetical protein [Paenibacillus sp. 1P07SE]
MRSILISVMMVVLVIVIYDSFGRTDQGAQEDVRQWGGRFGRAVREIDP